MAKIKSATPTGARQIDTLCDSVEDMGLVETKFGTKPMVRFTFESDELNQYGGKRRYTRLFHKHNHEKSSLSVAVKSWTGRDLAAEADDIEDVNWDSFVKLPARLTLEPGSVKDGKYYENITAIEEVKSEATDPDCSPDIELETAETKNTTNPTSAPICQN